MPSYKLIYFNARGRAEVARYMLKMNDVEFEDFRIEGTWQQHKPNTPFGSVPVLEVDGVPICQTSAIERMLAKRFGLYGKNDVEQAKSDMVTGCGEDIMKALMKANTGETDEEKTANKKKFAEEQLPTMLTNLQKMVGNDGFFLGKQMMWADIALAHLFTFFEVMKLPLDLSDYPKLHTIKSKVEAHPKIAAWIKARPQSTF